MDKKDSERGEEMVRQCATMTSKRNQKSCCMQPSTCIIVFLLVLTLSVSLLALCVSLLSYWQVNMEGKQKQLPMTAATGQPVVDEEEMEKTVLYKLEEMMKENEDMHFHHHSSNPASPIRSERSSDDDETLLDAMCNSTASNENEVPLAHIVPQSGRKEPIPYVGEAHSIITPGWICSSSTEGDSTYEGRVHGGMIFNRTSGFLRLPKDGFYYVYSQVIFAASRKLEGEAEIHSKMVACIPGDKCTFPNSHSKTHLQSIDYIEASEYEALLHGGLFHFPAGTQIAIIASNLLHSGTPASYSRPPLNYNGLWTQTYMGAFLVDVAPFEQD